MKIQTFIDIVEGKLLNSPYISAFENIRTNYKNVRRGDLFIAYVQNDIQKAINNGAYGILVDKEVQVVDQEIAWVIVNDLHLSVKRLIDVSFTHNHSVCILLSAFEYDLISKILSDKKNIVLLSGDIKEDLESLFDDREDILYVSKNERYKEYFRNIEYLKQDSLSEYKITKSSLFETSLMYDGQLFENIRMPSIFVKSFVAILDCMSKYKMTYSLQGYQSAYFVPTFIDDNFKVVDYGKSQKVIVFENDYSCMYDELDFVSSVTWTDKIIVLVEDTIENIDKKIQIFYFKDNEELRCLLKTKIYYVALIFSKDSSIESLDSTPVQPSLFTNKAN